METDSTENIKSSPDHYSVSSDDDFDLPNFTSSRPPNEANTSLPDQEITENVIIDHVVAQSMQDTDARDDVSDRLVFSEALILCTFVHGLATNCYTIIM